MSRLIHSMNELRGYTASIMALLLTLTACIMALATMRDPTGPKHDTMIVTLLTTAAALLANPRGASRATDPPAGAVVRTRTETEIEGEG
jgi:hypothetical protein